MNIDSFIYLDRIRAILFLLPGVTEGVCYGTAAFYVKKKILARLKEDGKTLAIYTEERDKWIKADPATFFLTDHYRNYPMMLLRLATVKQKDLQTLLTAAWQLRAPKKLLKEYENNKKNV